MTVVKIMRRVFEGMEEEDKNSTWLENDGRRGGGWRGSARGGRGRGRGTWRGTNGRNPLNKEGRISTCVICSSEWHWANSCPKNFLNREKAQGDQKDKEKKGKESEDEKKEQVFMGDSGTKEGVEWEDIEAILDTGCKSTVCGDI